MRTNTVGVIKAGHIYVSGAGTRQIARPLECVSDVLRLARSLDLWSVWLVDVDTAAHDWWTLSAADSHLARYPREDREEPHTAALYTSERAYGEAVFVCDLARDPRWPASGDPDVSAQEWAMAVMLVEQAIRQPVRFSPGSAGLRYLRATLPDPVKVDTLPVPELPMAPAANWARPAPKARYWHLFDRNAAYLAAMQSTPLGVGKATGYVDGPPKQPSKRHTLVRLHNGEFERAHAEYPNLFRAPGYYDGALARLLSWQPTHGYQYEAPPVILREFADQLWQLRVDATARNARLLLALVKAIYAETYGNLNSDRIGATKLYRPHWHAAIRAESARRVIHDARNWEQYGAFAASIDLIVVASESNIPDRALPVAIERRGKLGGYKSLGVVRVTTGLLAATRAAMRHRNGGELVAALNHHRETAGDGDE